MPLDTPDAPPGQIQSTRWDLMLYLLGGFGVFILASLLLSVVSKTGTPVDSFARYALNFLIFSGSFYFLGIRRGKITFQSVGLVPGRWRQSFLLIAALLVFTFLPIRAVLGFLAQQWFGDGIGGLQFRTQVITGGGFTPITAVITLLGAGIFAPLAEELYFRGLLHTWLQSHTRFWPRVLVSSFLFALGHIDSIGVVVSSFVMGIVIAVAFERSRSLWLPILIHTITNLFAVILLIAATMFGFGG
jgi:membrane protease YdiL (CAAX protease family)